MIVKILPREVWPRGTGRTMGRPMMGHVAAGGVLRETMTQQHAVMFGENLHCMIQALNYIPALCYGPGVYFSLHMGAA